MERKDKQINTLQESILLVEDDQTICDILQRCLCAEGYKVASVANCQEASKALAKAMPNLILLDWMLPDEDGIRFFRQIRSSKKYRDIAIIILSARNANSDQAFALDQGVDDFIGKPFSQETLLARIRAVLRRRQTPHIFRAGDIQLDVKSHILNYGVATIRLFPVEVAYMIHFLEKPHHVFSRHELMSLTSGAQVIEARTIDVHISRLRSKLKKNGCNIIQTVRGVGYTIGNSV